MQWFLGELVRSKQGRDQGRYYVVVKAEEQYCFLADGRKATIEKPKKKNYKHLQGTKTCCTEIQEKIRQGGTPTNGEVREFLNHHQPKRVTEEE